MFKKSKFKKPQFYIITLLGTCSRFSCRFPIHLAGVVLLLHYIIFICMCAPECYFRHGPIQVRCFDSLTSYPLLPTYQYLDYDWKSITHRNEGCHGTEARTIRFFLRLDQVCCKKSLATEKKHDVLQMIGYYIIYILHCLNTLYRYEWKIVFLSCIVCRIIIELRSHNYYILQV